MSQNESGFRIPAVSIPSRLARVFQLLEPTRDANPTFGIEKRSGRAAKISCVAIALTAVSLFGIAEVPTPLRMAARAAVGQVVIAYFVPAFLLLLAGDQFPD
jgi:hypothetical protein